MTEPLLDSLHFYPLLTTHSNSHESPRSVGPHEKNIDRQELFLWIKADDYNEADTETTGFEFLGTETACAESRVLRVGKEAGCRGGARPPAEGQGQAQMEATLGK